MMPFRHFLVGDVRLVVTIPGRPSKVDFERHLEEAKAMLGSTRVALIVSGGDLTAGERARMAEAGIFRPKTAVLTSSLFARGILTAIRWLGGTNAGFAPHQFAEACAFLGIPESQRGEIRQKIAELKAQLTSLHPHDVRLESLPVMEATLNAKSAVDARVERMRQSSVPPHKKNTR